MSTEPDFPSKNQITKAGKYLRDCVRKTIATEDVDLDRYFRSIDIVTIFREAHGYPMTKVRSGLASMINTESIDAALSQRHKRVPRIVRKLVRMGDTNLSRLEDIGGCRIVVQSPQDMDAICRRIRKNWTSAFTRDPRDYIASPKDIGYRARHFVVRRDERAIEIQVRTVGQQRWADAVEAIDGRLGLKLKDGEGPESLLENFRIAGELIYRQEFGVPLDDELIQRLHASNDRVIAEGYYTR
ncbi:RelA/SpoT domain-containing protein [Nocardioides sp. L-11A]|uniref:RelA/SpoT domain-containing protein n=1 Tax=Nocardioides sp. L-11A TaxID=3043848 RepID=UPI00249ADE06|nr:RelA/SpoT domain-containing protein [Nocardioides sp. L-11A]